MPSRPTTQVIGRVSWDIPYILYSSIIKTRFLLFEFTSLSETNLKVIHYGVAANTLSWEFRDSSHGEAYRRGSTLVTMGPARDCANRDTSIYPGSGPSRLEVNPYFLPALY
jgi:hypothetical protein